MATSTKFSVIAGCLQKGNKHLRRWMWWDAVPFDPVLSERDLKKQTDRRSDRHTDGQTGLAVRQTAGGGDAWRQQTCSTLIRLVWSSDDITAAPPQLTRIQCVRASISGMRGILRSVHTFANK